MDLTIAVAIGAGLLSFLSPCVLPLVPAYIGQLSAVAVVGRAEGIASRWLAVRHALAYVAGFGAVFTSLGITATYAAGPLFDWLPILRQAGGLLLIVLGLNLAGVLRIPILDRTWRPLEAGAAGSVASATGTLSLAAPSAGVAGRAGTGARFGDRLGGRIVGTRGGWLASFGLGALRHSVGWPVSHLAQRPQCDSVEMMTVSPSFTARTPTPTASMTPAPSCPSTTGTG